MADPTRIQTRPGNPLLNAPDEVLRAAVTLENDPSFRSIVSWLTACWAAELNRLPSTKEDIDYRWTQGHTQALLIVMNTVGSPREELQKREAKAKEAAASRNL